MSVHSTYYLRDTGRLGGETIVVVKCRGEEVANMLLRRTRRSAHNNRRALVNVHDDAHRCYLGERKARFTLDHDCPIECHEFKLEKVLVRLRWQTRTFKVLLSLVVCL